MRRIMLEVEKDAKALTKGVTMTGEQNPAFVVRSSIRAQLVKPNQLAGSDN